MSFGAILGFGFGALGPVAMACACVLEFLARRMAKAPRCDKKRLDRYRQTADIALVAAWLLLAASYLSVQWLAPDAQALSERYQMWMTWMLLALLVLDIIYLGLRRSRPRPADRKKYFWER